MARYLSKYFGLSAKCINSLFFKTLILFVYRCHKIFVEDGFVYGKVNQAG